MTPDLEAHLWGRIPNIDGVPGAVTPRDVINKMVETGLIQNPKQAHATLRKWSKQGKYNYGVSLDLGWKE